MKRIEFFLLFSLMISIHIYGQGKQIADCDGSKNYFVGWLPKSDDGDFHKLKIQIMGGNWYSNTLGENTYYIATRDGNIINQEVHGGGYDHYTLKAFDVNGRYEFVIQTNNICNALVIRSWALKDIGYNTLTEQDISLYDTSGKTDVTSQFQIKTLFATNAAGNVGIGTLTPINKLDINGVVHVAKGIMLGSAFTPDPAFINNEGNYISFSHPGVSEDFIGYRNNTFFLKDSQGGGDTAQPNLIVGGKLGVNLNNDSPQSELDVNGTIRAKEVIVTDTGWADFVFDKDYKLRDLKEVDRYIQENGHLPDIPSAAEVKEKGVNLVEVQAKLLQKVEEMTRYILEQQKEIESLKATVKELKLIK